MSRIVIVIDSFVQTSENMNERTRFASYQGGPLSQWIGMQQIKNTSDMHLESKNSSSFFKKYDHWLKNSPWMRGDFLFNSLHSVTAFSKCWGKSKTHGTEF